MLTVRKTALKYSLNVFCTLVTLKHSFDRLPKKVCMFINLQLGYDTLNWYHLHTSSFILLDTSDPAGCFITIHVIPSTKLIMDSSIGISLLMRRFFFYLCMINYLDDL